MYLSIENKKKLILVSILLGLSTISIIVGKTLANTIILTSYPTRVLPYFYFALAILMILVTMISSKFQEKNLNHFAFIFKFIFLCSILFFIAGIQWGGSIAPFVISILLLASTSIVSVISWNYVSDIFDIQEFKRFSKILQTSSTIGAIAAGVLVGAISTQFSPSKLLILIFLVELISLLFISLLAKYLSSPKPISKTNLKFSSTMKQNSIFKYLALMSIASVITTTLIDYNLKLELTTSIDKQNLAYVISIIFVICTTSTLIAQLFFLDYLLHVLGSKKLIIIYPIGVLITALAAFFHFNFIMMALLFIVSDILNYSTLSLSRNLYLNILPQAIKNLSRMKLSGTITPLAIILSSGVIFCITMANNKTTLSLVLIMIFSIYSLYLAKILIKNYRLQLIQSLYLRRFNSDLINMAQVDNKDIEDLLKHALSYPDTESTLFGLQLLMRDKSLHLTKSLTPLLTGENPKVVKECAKLLASHGKNKLFIEEAKKAFAKSNDEETKWYLTLYLIGSSSDSLISWVGDFLNKKTGPSLAIACLIYLKQGDLEQQLIAMESLLNMFHSQDIKQKKWFLYVLKEISLLQKEKYLIQYIEQNNLSLQTLALQQVGTKPSTHLLDSLVAHLGEPNSSPALNNCLVEIGENVVDRVEDRLKSASTYPIKMSCIRTLSLVNGTKSELSLMNVLLSSHDVVIKTTVAKYIAYRGAKLKISASLYGFLIETIKIEVGLYFLLLSKLGYYESLSIQNEINSRLQFIKIRVLYYSAALIGSMDILNSVSLLTTFHPDKNQQSIALELIDATAENREVSSLLLELFIEKKIQVETSAQPIDDPWLNQFIQDMESNNMDSIYTLTKLRKIALFKDLAAETLQVLAQCCSTKDMAKDEVIFSEGDLGDGLYIIDSGEVSITKNGIQIDTLTEGAYFGELALLADMPRFATVTAISEGVLFYIDKQDFDRITDEIPEIMKSINKQVIKYLTKNAVVLSRKD